MAQKIENIAELKILCNDEQAHDCYISIAGIIRSSKSVFMYEDGTFSVINEIDDSEDLFTETELSNPELSIIGKAIQKGQFHSYYDFK
jgi:hypothetical protein